MKIGAFKIGNRVLNILQITTLSLPLLTQGAVIWSGPDATFTKPAFADWTQPANQDHLTDGVALTRANSQGLFNIVLEPSYTAATSPAGTTWAFQGLNGNPATAGDMTAANYQNLSFSDWQTSLGGPTHLNGNIVNRPGVLHLTSEDIYLNVMFTDWSSTPAAGGEFSYTHSTPVPEPEQTALMAVGLIGLASAVRAWNARQRPRATAR